MKSKPTSYVQDQKYRASVEARQLSARKGRRMDRSTATDIFLDMGIPEGWDFHELSSSQVDKVRKAADLYGYRAPRNANGSTARYFYAYLNRAFNKA